MVSGSYLLHNYLYFSQTKYRSSYFNFSLLHFIRGNFFSCVIFKNEQNFVYIIQGRKEGNVLVNDALNTFYLRLYGVRHMVKNHSDSERGNPLLPHGLLFPINSKGSFICTIPQTG